MVGGGNLVRDVRYRKTPRTPRSAHARYYYTRSVVDSPLRKKREISRARCQSAPKLMDSHSRSASPRDPPRPQHRPPSPPSPAGFDNRAYQHDEDPNHNDSFASNQPQNGHKPNGDTKTLEAVNLELINLTPKNGAKKKDVEVDMNATNPYDEYFVPVNEHRKYMRGEKLYVTADKRGEKPGCKRPLCWTLLGLVVAVIVALIVLAATGILFSNSPTPLEQYNASLSSARAFGGIGSSDHDHSSHDHDSHDHSHHHHHEDTTIANVPSIEEARENTSDDSDINMYVPRTVEGELRIDNEKFVPELQDPESDEYREFTSIFNDALKQAIFDKNDLDMSDNDVTLEVVQIRNGSIVVTYRIHWIPKYNAEPTEDLLTANSLRSNLNDYLGRNNRMISVYHVAEESVNARPVLDMCKVNNNDCEYGCEFDDTTLEFTCTCPSGQMTNINLPKTCVSVLNNAVSEPKSTMKSIPEDKLYSESEQESNPVPTTESELNFSHIFGEQSNPNPEPTAEDEAKHEPVATSEPNPAPEPTAEPNMSVEPAAEPEPSAEPKPTAEPEPEPANKSNQELESTAEPKQEPEPTAEPKQEPEPSSEPKPEPEPTAEPKPEPTAEPEPEPSSEPEPEPSSEPEPEPSSEPKSEPVPPSETKQDPIPQSRDESESNSELETSSEPKPEPEPTSQPEPSPAIKINPEQNSQTTQGNPQTQSIIESNQEHSTSTKQYNLQDIYPFLESQETNEESSITTESNTMSGHMHESELRVNNRGSDIESEYSHTNDFKPFPESTQTLNVATESMYQNDGDTHIETGKEVYQSADNEKPIKDYLYPITESDAVTTTETVSILYQDNKQDEEIDDKSLLVKSRDSSSEETSEQKDHNDSTSQETTTARVSISDFNIKNDPSYEPKPEIISILKDNDSTPNVETTTSGDWLQNDDINLAFPYTNKPIFNLNSQMHDSKNENDDITFDTLHDKNENTSDMKTTTLSTPLELTTTPTKINEESDIKAITITTEQNNYNVANDAKTEVLSLGEDIKNHMETSTTSNTETNVYSISNDYKITNENSDLIDAVARITTTSTEKPKDEKVVNENEEVTFDALNSLYNRSSKSIENLHNDDVKTTTFKTIPNESTDSTTDSDWLSESVTEVNYEDIIKSQNSESTELPAIKVDEAIRKGLNKDDFEPDYLNNMGNNNSKMSEQDEPLYGIIHDYDNEDPRVKRVNNEHKSENTLTQVTTDSTNLESTIKSDFAPIETTTVTDYIYKTANVVNRVSPKSVNDEESSMFLTNNPAPVWEEQGKGDSNKGVVIKEIANETAIHYTNKPNTDTLPSTSLSIVNENSSQVNNLGVTIYEVPSQNLNLTTSSPKTLNSPAQEYDDHETEMNPFLPEVENNKILVKKLQEGHDLEPTSLNETQNEGDEHNSTSIDDKTTNTQTLNEESVENAPQTVIQIQPTEKDASDSEQNETKLNNEESTKSDSTLSLQNYDLTTKRGDFEVLPISKFLLDTDDLDYTNGDNKILMQSTLPENVLFNDSPTEYLNVVPILEKETIKKNYKSENLELNSISDSPKKSDRRTLDVTNADSVNNEA
ncbi:unnamed protein product [Leptosia nina]|uniref:SEA domain-containing protein n=1 Tax=Leptosia nina TaxID=320188 RepID=A0AAV1JJN2_9NEOP